MSILFDNPPPAIGCGDPGDPIDFGCLFDGAQRLVRIPTVTGNRRLMCGVFWVKRSAISATGVVFGRTETLSSDSDYLYVPLLADAGVRVDLHTGSAYEGRAETVSAYLDPAGFSQFHIVIDIDNDIADERIRITKDGIRQAVTIPYPVLENTDVWANVAGIPFYIGVNGGYGGFDNYLRAILCEFAWFDGVVPAPTEFGYFNTYGDWVPKAFSGKGEGAAVYGVNGFHLDYADPLDLGKDVSGNGNHLSAFGLTVDHQVTDTPTRNKMAFDPNIAGDAGGYSAGNAQVSGNNAVQSSLSYPIKSGVVHVEAEIAYGNSNSGTLRVADSPNFSSGVSSISYRTNGQKQVSGVWSAYGSAFGSATSPTDRMGIQVDADEQTVEFFKAGVSQGVISIPFPPPYFIGGTKTGLNSGFVRVFTALEDMLYPVEGAGTLEWDKIACPDILNPDDYFTHRIKTGGEIVSDLPFNPTVHKALVVSKCIDADEPCVVTDTVNWAGFAWETSSAVNGITARPQGLIAFTANGYTIGSDTAYQGNRLDLIWRASPRAGFDIVTVDHTTGTPTTVPQLSGGVIEYGWVVRNNAGQTRRMFHHLLGNDRYFPMDTAGGPVTDAGWFSSTANTVTLGDSVPTGIYTLYIWRSVPQFSSFGKYAPNDNNDGPFLPLDFSPRLFQPNGGGPNGTRSIFVDDLVVNGGNDPRLALEVAAEAVTAYEYCDFVSNGVKARGVYTPINYSDTDFYYPAAWARTPGKFARAR